MSLGGERRGQTVDGWKGVRPDFKTSKFSISSEMGFSSVAGECRPPSELDLVQ